MRLSPDGYAIPWTAAALGVSEDDLMPGRGAFVVDAHEAVAAGVVIHSYRPRSGSAEVTAAAKTPRWLQRGVLRSLADYVFRQLDCQRLEAHLSERNRPAARLLERLGFEREGSMRRAWDGVDATLIYGLLREDCRWYDPVEVPEDVRQRAASNPERDGHVA